MPHLLRLFYAVQMGISEDKVRVIAPEVGGGFGGKLQIFAEQFGVRTAWHGPGDMSPLAHAANIHIDLVARNFGVQEWSGTEPPNFVIQEFLIDHPPEVERLFAQPFTWLHGGWVEPPTGPGLGVELDWDVVRSHEQLPYRKTYQESLWHVDGAVADW